MAIRPRGIRWQADIYDKNGKRHRPLFAVRSEAIAWQHNAKLALERGEPLPLTPAQEASQRHQRNHLNTLQDIFNFLVRREWGNLKGSQTLIKNGRDVVNYLGGLTSPASITTVDIERMKAHFAERGGMAPATINRKLAALSKMLKTAYEHDIIAKIPVIKWNREVKTKFRYLDKGEEARLLDYWLDIDRLDMYEFCLFLLETGARLSEAEALSLDDIAPNLNHVTFWQTKTDKPRTIPLTLRCREMMQTKLMRERQTKNRHNNLFHATLKIKFRQVWAQMQQDLGWPDVTPHTLRHTCCTKLIQKGVDIKRVMEWMGHSNITTTSRYMQISPQGLADIMHLVDGEELDKTTSQPLAV